MQLKPQEGCPPDIAYLLPGVGNYGAVGFSYTSAGLSRDSDSDSDSDASVSSDEERDTTQQEKHSAADRIAEGLGLSNFSSILRHAERQEEDEAQGRKPRKRCAAPTTSMYAYSQCQTPSALMLMLGTDAGPVHVQAHVQQEESSREGEADGRPGRCHPG